MIRKYQRKEGFTPFTLKPNNKVVVRINTEVKDGFIYYDEYTIRLINKNNLISSLIKANYPSDRMDAIRNNYELVKDGTAGDKEEEYTQEYLAMQDWRAHSKELATEIMNAKENVT